MPPGPVVTHDPIAVSLEDAPGFVAALQERLAARR